MIFWRVILLAFCVLLFNSNKAPMSKYTTTKKLSSCVWQHSAMCVCFECILMNRSSCTHTFCRKIQNKHMNHLSLFRLLWALCAERKTTPKLETTECTGIAMTHSLTYSVVPLRVVLMESEGDLTSSWWSLFTSLSSIGSGNTDSTQSVNKSIPCILRGAASP